MKLKPDEIRITQQDAYFCGNEVIIVTDKQEEVKNDILTNQKLRERIVDLADLWDGKESSHYGNRLQDTLNSLGIKDVPEFYKTENINKFLKEMKKKRH